MSTGTIVLAGIVVGVVGTFAFGLVVWVVAGLVQRWWS